MFLPRHADDERAARRINPAAVKLTVVTAPPLTAASPSTDGEPVVVRARNVHRDEALRNELINVLSSLCAAGLTSIYLHHVAEDASRQVRRKRSSAVSP